MNKPRQAAITLALAQHLRKNGSWCGETHLQKAAYFLQNLAQVPLGFDFVLYKHGPFSFELRDELASLRADGLMELEVRPYPYGPTLAVSEAGRELEQRFSATLKEFISRVDFVASRLGSKRVHELEQLATALYVMQTEPALNEDQIAQKIVELKPHVTPAAAKLAVDEVRQYKEQAASESSAA